MKPFLSALPNHSADRNGRFFDSDIDVFLLVDFDSLIASSRGSAGDEAPIH